MRLSIVIPVLNEAEALPATLRALPLQRGDCEIIVVDGGSTDGTCDTLPSDPPVRVIRAAKGRAVQMNAGAGVATGDWILFLHADTLLPADALGCIAAVAAEGRCEAGAFRHRFTQPHWMLSIVSAVNNVRCRCTRIFYGDQGIFVRRDLFDRLGGFPEVPVLEDILFSERLRRATRTALLYSKVLTDGRRFIELGIVRTSLRALYILACHQLRLPVSGRGFREEIR